MAYSVDYRIAAIEFKQNGHTFEELKEVLRITPQTYYNWLNIKEKTGSLKVRTVTTRQRKIVIEELKKAVEEKPDAYLSELAKPFGCTEQAVFYALEKHNITYKKNHSHTRKNPKKNGKSM